MSFLANLLQEAEFGRFSASVIPPKLGSILFCRNIVFFFKSLIFIFRILIQQYLKIHTD